MRIAHCIHGLGLGGAQKVIASIVRGDREGHREYLVYAAEDGVLRRDVEDAGAKVRILPRTLPKFDPTWVVRLARAMRRDRIDLVHAHLFGDSLHGYLAARTAGRPSVILTLHIGVEGLNPLQKPAYRWLVRRCDRTVACSEAVRSSFSALFADASEHIITIPNGLEVRPASSMEPASEQRARAGLGLRADELVLAAIGRLEEQKGLDLLISAFASLRRRVDLPMRLVLLGEGSLRDDLEQQARREGVADEILFAGFRPNVSELLSVIDVVVFSSRFEGLPVALLEAMAASRCIVATDVPGMLEATRPEREALISPVGESEPLADSLERVVTDRELRGRLAANARQRFLDEFTADRMVERYSNLYRTFNGDPPEENRRS